MSASATHDVIVIGGGPAGSTTGAFIRKYSDFGVLILERERFPREHVGESQLPPIGAILHEMGCWDAVEAAGFPIKVGATLRWGREQDLWDLDFIRDGALAEQARPAPYAGQRKQTALQVDRAAYDHILLRHAEQLGCDVRQEARVTRVLREGDAVTGIELADGEVLHARWYVDASGHSAVVRRGMDVKIDCPGQLKNVACWDYWDDVAWADTIGVGGTRVQVLSISYGWLWFIPVSPTRASVGLVVSAQFFKDSGKTFPELYLESVTSEPRIAELTRHASQRGDMKTTKDWSFLADRACGDNWFLVGEAVGFADPVLAAGMTLAQVGARELACTLMALLRGEHDASWLKKHYQEYQRTRIWQHIRFADFWYAANGQFTDLKDQCREIARDAGLQMTADEAWTWLAQGGFAHDFPGQAMVGGYDLASVKQVTQRFLGEPAEWRLSKVNRLQLELDHALRHEVPHYRDGKVIPTVAFERQGRTLLMVGVLGLVAKLIPAHPRTPDLVAALRRELARHLGAAGVEHGLYHALQTVELLLSEGWVSGIAEPGQPFVVVTTPDEGAIIHRHRPIDSGRQG